MIATTVKYMYASKYTRCAFTTILLKLKYMTRWRMPKHEYAEDPIIVRHANMAYATFLIVTIGSGVPVTIWGWVEIWACQFMASSIPG